MTRTQQSPETPEGPEAELRAFSMNTEKVTSLKHSTPVAANQAITHTMAVVDWLRTIHGKSRGVFHISSTLGWEGRRFRLTVEDVKQATEHVRSLANSGAAGIYLRMTTIDPRRIPFDDGRKRGPAEASVSLPCLWADLDIQGPGHKHQPNMPGWDGYDPKRRIVLPLPVDEDEAFAILTRAALPVPTMMIHSGGGLYPIWIFDEPVDCSETTTLEQAQRTSENLQKLIGWAAAENGVHYGTGVGDLARVLRIPGTQNRKVDGAPVWCRPLPDDLGYSNGRTWDFEEFSALVDLNLELLAASQPTIPDTPEPTHDTQPSRIVWGSATSTTPHTQSDDTPLNRLEAKLSWADILAPHGWKVHHEGHRGETYWTRPGKERRDGWSATTGMDAQRDRMFCFSDAAGLPVQQSMTKGFVYAQLNHAGDLRAAALEFADQHRAQTDGVILQSKATACLNQQTQEAVQQEWLPPRSLTSEAGLPEFPVDQLPGVMRDMVDGVSREVKVDPAIPAMFALSSVSALVAPRVMVSNGLWREQLSLYAIGAAKASESKSPSSRPFENPLHDIERRMRHEHADKMDLAIAEKRVKGDSLKGAVSLNRVEDEIKELEDSKQNPPMIVIPSDATAEAVSSRMSKNGGFGSILDSEGTIVSTWSGRYSNGKGAISGLEIFLKGYDGDAFAADRISRGMLRIDRAVMSICCTAQIGVVRDLARNDQLNDRGLMSRFIFAFPKSHVGHRHEMPDHHNPDHIVRAWATMLEGLAEIPMPDPEARRSDVPCLVLTDEAKRLWLEHRAEIEPRLGDQGDLHTEGLGSWGGKHVGRVLRLAGILHLAEGWTQTDLVSEENMRRAIAIGLWSIEHAKHFFVKLAGYGTDESEATVSECSELLKVIRRRSITSATRRELARAASQQWAKGDKLRDAIDQLVEAGYLREVTYLDRANRQRTRYMVNPLDPM